MFGRSNVLPCLSQSKFISADALLRHRGNAHNASDALAMNTKADNVDRFPNRVPYLVTMEQLRKEFGIKPD